MKVTSISFRAVALKIWATSAIIFVSATQTSRRATTIPTDTYQNCEVPSFEWATYSTKTTARMYAMKGTAANGFLYAAGFLKSTVDTNESPDQESQFTVSGPYSIDDPTGMNAGTISIDLPSYSGTAGAVENAGGSFGQYDVGIVKVSLDTGLPSDVFVYSGHGLDETSGIAVSNQNVLAVSGHFTGNLTVALADGSTTKTILNSNLEEGSLPDDEDQFHPNSKDGAGETGEDDGFVIKANASTGLVDWLVHYPKSNKDSQIIGVDVDDDGNIYGSGYKCSMSEGASAKECVGIVAKFASSDGSIVWERTFADSLQAALWIKIDNDDDKALYVTGTTSYGGSSSVDVDEVSNPYCAAGKSCAVTMRLSAETGTTHWMRTVEGSPRWGVFDQSGDIELATHEDGPYVYVAFDDTGEQLDDELLLSLDVGTPYAGCKSISDDTVTPEYEISTIKLVDETDCPSGTTYVSRTDVDHAVPASMASTGVVCGSRTFPNDACLIKYHKYTGLPIWGIDLPPVAGIVPSIDGKSIHAAGWYSSRSGAIFDSVELPGFMSIGGLRSQLSGIYNANIDAQTGKGRYVLNSGGGSKDRLYDIVGDDHGDIYNVGYSMNLNMIWGGTLKTSMSESDVNVEDVGIGAVETHVYVSKLSASLESVPSCLTSCENYTGNVMIQDDKCFIDGVCYSTGDDASPFGKSCFHCDPSKSQTEWTSDDSKVGTTHCYIVDEGMCVSSGEFLYTQRRTWAEKVYSDCQMCDPVKDEEGWSTLDGYMFVDGICNVVEDTAAEDTTTEETTTEETTTEETAEEETGTANMPQEVDNNEDISMSEKLRGGAVTGIIMLSSFIWHCYLVD